MKYYEEISRALEEVPVINTHCHNIVDDKQSFVSLRDLLSATYCGWNYDMSTIEDDPARFFQTMGCTSYAYWLLQAYGKLYDNGTPLNEENYPVIAKRIQTIYETTGSDQLQILEQVCRYRGILLDDYHDPGNSHGYSVMLPTYRVDMFLHGYDKHGTDQNENCPYDYLSVSVASSFEDYMEKVQASIVARKKEMHCHSLKLAIAYERDLKFEVFDEGLADLAIQKRIQSPETIRAFQDTTIDRICKIAAELDMPVQIHTGLGCLQETRAIGLLKLIQRNPKTRFVLFHGSYPWMEDILALAHNFQNVYPDLCWLPLLSTSSAEQFLPQLLDIAGNGRICWGCDTWTAQESYGALLAIRHVLAKVFSQKVEEGFYSMPYALELAKNILYGNAKELYRISD